MKKKVLVITAISMTLCVLVGVLSYMFVFKKISLSSKLNAAIEANDLVKAEELLKKGADPNHKDLIFMIGDVSPKYPIIYSCTHAIGYGPGPSNDVEMVALMLKYGADVNLNKSNKGTPLTCMYYDIEIGKNVLSITKLLIENGADVNLRDKKRGGNTPLEVLLREGFDANDSYLNEERRQINIERRKSLVKLLIENGAVFEGELPSGYS